MYCAQLYYFARKRLGTDDQAADCVQAAFLYALYHIEELRDPASFRSWLYRICSSEISAVFKEKSCTQRQSYSLDEMSEDQQGAHEDLQVPEPQRLAEEHVFATEQQDKQLGELLNCLAHLTDVQKDMIILRYYAELEPSEIARVLGISAVAARKRLHDAIAALRKYWTQTSTALIPDNQVVARLLRQDYEAAQYHGDRPEAPIALRMGAALPALLAAHPSASMAGRATAFLQAAHTGDASALVQTGTPLATASAHSGLATLRTTTAGKLACVAVALVLVAGLGYGAYALQNAGSHKPIPQASALSRVSKKDPVEGANPGSPSGELTSTAAPAVSTITTPTPETAAKTDVNSATTPAQNAGGAAVGTLPAPASKASVAASPTLTLAHPALSYAADTALTPAILLADAGAVARDGGGTPLAPTIGNYANLDAATPGDYQLFIHAIDAVGKAAPTRILRVTIERNER